MNKYIITYKITTYSIIDKLLNIQLSISNTQNRFLKFFKGKIKFLDFTCNSFFTEDNNYYYIETSNNTLNISYNVKISTPGKHGFYGELSNDLIVFAGEQVLLLPIEALTCNSRNSSDAIDNIIINYNISNNNCIVPFKEKHFDSIFSICKSPKWSDIYELMKSPFIFSDLFVHTHSNLNSNLNIYIDSNLKNTNTEIIKGLNSLFDYYNKLFNYKPQNLSIILLSYNSDFGILGGCGRSIICSSFNEDTLRDWQLLSHRMFHAFMDTALPLSDFHTPPTLWITEGLATYYENMALEALSNKLKYRLNLNTTNEFIKLFNRYIYTTLKNPYIFSFPPMEEINISSAGKIEFLHYTQAPLIIKLIEDKYSKSNKKDIIINELLKLDISKDFLLEKLFTNILGTDVNIFASKYLFNIELLPMWYLNNNCSESEEDVLADLNYYEYVLYTWMSLEDPSYMQDELSSKELSLLSKIAEKNGVHFAPTNIEKQVRNYSLTIYKLLKQFALRAEIYKNYK